MIGSAITTVVVLAGGSLPFTVWNAKGDGVPRADEWVFVLFLISLGILNLSAVFGGIYSCYDPVVAPKLHFGWKHTWRARVPAMVIALGISSVAMLGPLASGESPRFLFMEYVMLAIVTPFQSVAGEIAARWSAGNANQNESDKKGKKRKKGSTAWSLVVALFNGIALCFIVILYPLAIMPIYRSKNTTDGQRLLLVSFLHPMVHEVTMTVQRSKIGQSYLLEKTVNDPKRTHFAMAVSHGSEQDARSI